MKKILVTGGSSGIGKATCKHLSDLGYDVLGTSRNPSSKPSEFNLITLDVTDLESVRNAVKTIKESWGKIDVLINNAGIGFMGPLEFAKPLHIKNAWETNVFGLMQVTQGFLPLLQKSSDPRIINVGSIGGKMGLPYRGWYSAAKGSIEILSESLAMELKPKKIQVCTLLPGDVKTEIANSRLEPTVAELHDYADSYYNMKTILDKEMEEAIPPQKVAKAIAKLIKKQKMPLKHSVGSFFHKLTPIIKNLVPQRVFQYLILRHYK